MHIKEWVIRYQKKLSLGMGAVLISAALGILFWENTHSAILSEEKAYAQKVSAMEARMAGPYAAQQAVPEESKIMEAYLERQEKHFRYTLIVLIASGIGFILYGVIKKR